MERPFESEAASVYCSIRKLAENPDALDNFESYLSMHFDAWLKKYAANPASMAAELHRFAHMFDE